MALFDYQKAFGLKDNPLSPMYDFADVDKDLLDSLESLPLQIRKASDLKELYCESAGPFKQIMKQFDGAIGMAGYVPPRAGTRSFVFLIKGFQGTGKTTLANMMVYRLKRCKPSTGEWFVPDWPDREMPGAETQIQEITKFGEKLKGEAPRGAHCCVIIDNLLQGSERAAIDLWNDIKKDNRTVFLFLITSDLVLLDLEFSLKFSIEQYSTGPLDPDAAINFVRHRIGRYRAGEPEKFLTCPIFPFDEQDIRTSVSNPNLLPATAPKTFVTLRQLGVILFRALRDKMLILDEAYDISLIPAGQLGNHLIHLSRAVENMLNLESKVA